MTAANTFRYVPDWPEPAARFLRPERPEPPELPLEDALGPRWARWIRDAAAAKGAPPDYVVAGLLAVAGSLIGNARWVSPWAGWAEPPVLWCMTIGNPSANKSPGLDAALGPLKALEREMRGAQEAELAAWRDRAELAKLSASAWKEGVKAALKLGEETPPKPASADPGPEPVLPRLSVSDATVERLAVLVERQPRGLLMARDELSGWLVNMARYSGGSDRPFWLEAYGGRPYTVERMGRDPVSVERLSVGVVGGIQPDRLRGLLMKAGDDDGLLARILPFWPHPAPIARPAVVPDDVFLGAALGRLHGLRMVEDSSGERRPWFVPCDDDARDLLGAFREDGAGMGGRGRGATPVVHGQAAGHGAAPGAHPGLSRLVGRGRRRAPRRHRGPPRPRGALPRRLRPAHGAAGLRRGRGDRLRARRPPPGGAHPREGVAQLHEPGGDARRARRAHYQGGATTGPRRAPGGRRAPRRN